MNALLILLVAAVVLVIGYIFYGGWLAKQWGVDPTVIRPRLTNWRTAWTTCPPRPPYVVLGHHFSSIAGAGPINGPIQAAVFGWVPVLLWVLIGGIFFGAMHDFGSLFASLRHKGQTLAVVVAENIDNTAKKLFCIFAYLTLLLVVAAFASIVANTFAVVPDLDGTKAATNLANQQTAMISVIFIGVAVVYGILTRGRNIPGPVNIASAIVLIVIMVAIGYNLPLMGISLSLDYNTWMIILGVYILIASVAPVWILLQPRDYLSSYLLYGMILLAVIGIVGASLMGAATNLQIPAFTGFVATNAAFDASTGQALVDQAGKAITNKAAASGFLFPALFITIACGAISGFHSLVASGTTSKQLDREAEAQPIGYGGMLIECLLAVISLCAVGFVWSKYAAGGYASPTAVFADGLSQMLACIPGLADVQGSGICAAHPGRFRVLPDLARHRHPPGPLHVPGAVDPRRREARGPDGRAQGHDEPLCRHHHHRGHRRVPGHDRLHHHLAAVRRRQPAAGRPGAAGRVRMAGQRGPQQQDVLRAHGLHAGGHAHARWASRSTRRPCSS